MIDIAPKGKFTTRWAPIQSKCPKCQGTVERRTWESYCGGYEDYEFRCLQCGTEWWVDGPDA